MLTVFKCIFILCCLWRSFEIETIFIRLFFQNQPYEYMITVNFFNRQYYNLAHARVLHLLVEHLWVYIGHKKCLPEHGMKVMCLGRVIGYCRFYRCYGFTTNSLVKFAVSVALSFFQFTSPIVKTGRFCIIAQYEKTFCSSSFTVQELS